MPGLGGTAAEGLQTKPVAGLGGTAAEAKFIATGGELSGAELARLEGVVAGIVAASKALVVDANLDLASLRNLTSTGTLTAAALTQSGNRLVSGGAAAAAVVERYGASASEGYEVRVIDETLAAFSAAKTFDLTEDIPAGAVILSVQANIETAVVAGGTSVKVSVGIAGGDVDKYGKTADLTKNQKIDTIPVHAILASAEDVQVGIVVTDGSTLGDTDASAGVVRVRIVYAVQNSLDDAA